MAMIKVSGSGATAVEVFFEDEGAGAPVVLVRSTSLAMAVWKRLAQIFLEEGHRVVSYDRRVRSAAGLAAADFANDVNVLLTSLNVHQAAMVGHEAGAGDVVHYLGRFGSERVMRAVLIAPLPALPVDAVDVPVLVVAEIEDVLAEATIAELLHFIDD